ncbi:MAG: hypothetical protein M1834_001518 [Cirrosporium novae-zelandiae]|nr:MAG: hypothetical protein M1834_004035 [Cirrosporium novae-zelandiae]KAI9735503.1 MAG: hypothetical protein M1834_001518 [Cirrosporium novae-zelandiae]
MTLLDVYGIESIGKLTHEYYRAEYLAHCEIENTSNFRVVPLQALIDHGLYELFPELDEQEDPSQLARQVNEFRSQFFSRSSNVTIREAQLSRNLGELFGSNLALPVAVAFLSLQPRPESGDGFDIILEGLDDLEIPLPNNPDALAYRDPDVNTRNLEEVSTFMRLLRLLCATGWSGSEDGELSSRSSGSDDEDGLIREMNSLSLRGSKTVYDGENDEGNAYFEGIHGDADDSDDEAEENNW